MVQGSGFEVWGHTHFKAWSLEFTNEVFKSSEFKNLEFKPLALAVRGPWLWLSAWQAH